MAFTTVATNVPYGFDAQHKLDIFKHPEVDTNAPPLGAWVWVYFHGGGMTRGSKEIHGTAADDFLPWYDYLEGLTSTPWPMYVLSVNWRAIRTLGADGDPETRWASQPGYASGWQHDSKLIVQWIKENATINGGVYDWNPKLIVVGGPSGGGVASGWAAYGRSLGFDVHDDVIGGAHSAQYSGDPFGFLGWGAQINLLGNGSGIVSNYIGVGVSSDWDTARIKKMRRRASATKQAIDSGRAIPSIAFGTPWSGETFGNWTAHGVEQSVELHDHLRQHNAPQRFYFPGFDVGYVPGSDVAPPTYAIDTVVDLGLGVDDWPSADMFTFFTDEFENAGYIGGTV